MLTKLDETAGYNQQVYPLFCNRWADGTVDPVGNIYLERFYLEGSIPVWNYAFGDALLEKQIWMQQGENTTYIQYRLRRGSLPVTLTIKGFVNYRDRHYSSRASDRQMDIAAIANGVRVSAFPDAVPFYLLATGAHATPAHTWHYGFDLPAEADRGLDRLQDSLHAVTFQAQLHPGDSLAIVASTESNPNLEGKKAFAYRLHYEEKLLKRAKKGKGLKGKQKKQYRLSHKSPDWVKQLVLAADRFIVDRPLADRPGGKSIIAGYHWFSDWGRDTAIALPGLTLCTGRPKVARAILQTFARYVDKGMLPNRFPDEGETPDYNSVDATLWYFEAIRAYYDATGDKQLLAELWPILTDIVRWHLEGTRYNIHCDEDGLIYAGEPGVQLTWMDAKVGDWVVTPRQGKPVEINALWYNALQTMAQFGAILKKPHQEYIQLANRAIAGFSRFWNEQAGYCYDAIDTPNGNDSALRPNQIFAVSLHYSPLPPIQQRAVVDACGRSLLTSYGLRSLSPDDPAYIGHYGGTPLQRDAAYHQGTVWSWLIGPYIAAHLRLYGDKTVAQTLLQPLADHLADAGVGHLSEIFAGDPPFPPKGAIAQAWTVAEMLRIAALLNIKR